MLRVSLPFLAILLSTATISAQPTFRLGLRGGLNRATSTVAAASTLPTTYPFSYSATKSALYAWQAGAVLEVAFRHFAVQPALVFSQKGEQFDTYATTSGVAGQSTQETRLTSRPNWLELPVNMVYTLHGFQLFAGPYVALAVGGRKHAIQLQASPSARFGPFGYDKKVDYGNGTPNCRLDTGVNFGLGYRQGPLQVQLGYAMGLRNLHQASSTYIICEYPFYYHDFAADAAYNRVVQLTGTYFFKL